MNLIDPVLRLRRFAWLPPPDGGYRIVFADGSEDGAIEDELHASFKLGSAGEYLALVVQAMDVSSTLV